MREGRKRSERVFLLQQGGTSPAAAPFPGDINHSSAVSGFTLVQQMCKAHWERAAGV